MIYELVKRDPAWKAMPWYALVVAVACVCPSPVSGIGVFGVMMSLFVAFPNVHATRFDASLPIAGRDLVLARALSIMAMIWLTALAGSAAQAVSWGHSPVPVSPPIMASLCTLAAGVLQSIRARELAAPKWTFFPLSLLIPFTGMYLEHDRMKALIPALCALAGIALLVRTWSVAPKSFELAPARPGAGHSPARVQGDPPHLPGPARPALQTGVASPRFVWLPVLRSVFTAQYSMQVALLLFFAFGSARLVLCFWILILWLMARQQTLWLRPLPIRPRAFLIAMVGPILLAFAGGYFGGLHLSRHPKPIPALPVQVLDLGAALAWALVVVLASELVDWRRLSHISVKIRRGVGAALMLVTFVGALGIGPRGVDPLHIAVLRLARALPDSLAVAIALVAAVLGVLWLAIEKVFAEADHATKPRPQKDEYTMM